MASQSLGYDQAVADAKEYLDGLVNGLGNKKGLEDIKAAMKKIAKAMMKAIRDELEIKSPSRKSAEVGRQVVMGLIKQLDSMHGDVDRASAEIGKTALDTLQATMSNIGDELPSNIGLSPIITPVLDLTQLAKDATAISSLMAIQPISTDVSFAQASDISRYRAELADSDDGGDDGRSGDTYEYHQTNISPKPLSTVEIHRNTKSLLALKRGELGVE
jgi:hypothetical protein